MSIFYKDFQEKVCKFEFKDQSNVVFKKKSFEAILPLKTKIQGYGNKLIRQKLVNKASGIRMLCCIFLVVRNSTVKRVNLKVSLLSKWMVKKA